MRPMCNTKFRKASRLRRFADIIRYRHAEHTCIRSIKGHRGDHYCSCVIQWPGIVERIMAKYTA
jgi:hypothetical protein